jgi:cellulose synthase/poly-beta-1,6-N-acetylglucosamine synthase-like glycosyltransferase
VTVASGLVVFACLVISYFAIWNFTQFAMAVVSTWQVRRYLRRRSPRNRALTANFASPPLVSVIVPARNEALTIVDTVRALLSLDYEAREIMVVNDGSTDGTLAVLLDHFRLVPAPLAFDQPLKSAPVRGIYRSTDDPGLVVLDKECGGSKSDACNAGINAASGGLVLIIDADTMLEPDALSRAVLPFLEDPAIVAVGGYVGIANGCRIEGGRVVDVRMPRAWLARFQLVEYMRSFLLFRVAAAARNGLTLISGAFGLFQRDAVIAVGGYDHTAIGEDMDLTVRLQRFYRDRNQFARIKFIPLPLCWTQAPEDLPSLRAQRCRWRRGLMQVLWRQRRLIANPRFGVVGVGVLPYTTFFEGIGPLLELLGYGISTLAFILGLLNWHHYRVLLAATLLFGASATLVAIFLHDVATQRYRGGRDLAILVAVAVLENFGYRQLNCWWACVGTVQALRGKQGWGAMTRKAF